MSLCAYLLEDEKMRSIDLTTRLANCITVVNEQSAQLKQLKEEFEEMKKQHNEAIIKNIELLKRAK